MELLSAFLKGGMAEYTFGVVCAALMKAIHVELPDEGIHLAMAEVSG